MKRELRADELLWALVMGGVAEELSRNHWSLLCRGRSPITRKEAKCAELVAALPDNTEGAE